LQIPRALSNHLPPPPLSNLKLNLISPDAKEEISEDFYAKVLEKPAESGCFYIQFTSQPPAVEAKLSVLYKCLTP
jgi:hypothetical protein